MPVYSETSVSGLFTLPVADPGFPRGGGTNFSGGANIQFSKFSQKLHEIERIWITKGGGVHPSRPLRSATALRLK